MKPSPTVLPPWVHDPPTLRKVPAGEVPVRRTLFALIVPCVVACGSSSASSTASSQGDGGSDASAPTVDAATPVHDASKEAAPAPACSPTDPRNPPITLSVQPDDGETPIVNVLASAQHSIRVMVYDLGASQILDTLVAKAKAEIPVQVILDATEQSFDQPAHDQLVAAGAQVQWSNPVFTYTHAKTLVVDETVGVISTGNFDAGQIADERNYAMIDRDPQDVAQLVSIFDGDWKNTTPNLSCTRLVVSPVDSQTRILDEINSATQSIYIESMEFADSDVQQAVAAKFKAGLDVKVLVASPSFNSSITTAVKSMAYVGVYLRQMVTPDVHVKSILVDGKTAYAGSENLSYTSLTQNREVGLIVTEPDAIAKIGATFAKDWAASIPFPGYPPPPPPEAGVSDAAPTNDGETDGETSDGD
jgi:phosphatidylserine/phosphatidylglycerophosphate/cardiolipin synthase-like enzyme